MKTLASGVKDAHQLSQVKACFYTKMNGAKQEIEELRAQLRSFTNPLSKSGHLWKINPEIFNWNPEQTQYFVFRIFSTP